VLSYTTRKQLMERIRTLFGGTPCRLQVAALPWRMGADGVEVMLVTSRGTGRWVLPKGWPEKNEHLHEAAAREALEEAGLSGTISPGAFGRFYYGKVQDSGMEWRCEVHVFPLEVDDMAETWPEVGQRQRRWFAPAEAATLVAERDLGEIIVRFGASSRQQAA